MPTTFSASCYLADRRLLASSSLDFPQQMLFLPLPPSLIIWTNEPRFPRPLNGDIPIYHPFLVKKIVFYWKLRQGKRADVKSFLRIRNNSRASAKSDNENFPTFPFHSVEHGRET